MEDYLPGHKYVRDNLHSEVVAAIKAALAARTHGPRNKKDDHLFVPLNNAIIETAMRDDCGLACHLFHDCMQLVREHEHSTGSVLHKGAPMFNVGLAYLGAHDFTAAMHYFEMAQIETRDTFGEPGFHVYEFDLFDRIFWKSLDCFPNSVFQDLWGMQFSIATTKADWRKLTDATKLPFIIASAQRLRYLDLVRLDGWDGSESLRVSNCILAADMARLLETEARKRSTENADTLMRMLFGGFKTVQLGNLSARIKHWHDHVYTVKGTDRYNTHLPTIKSIILNKELPDLERIGHAVYLLGVTRNQVAHTVDTSLVLFQDPTAARFVIDLLFALCHLDGWAS